MNELTKLNSGCNSTVINELTKLNSGCNSTVMNEFGLHNATGMHLVYSCHVPGQRGVVHQGMLPPSTYNWLQEHHSNPVAHMHAPGNNLVCQLSAAGPMTSPNAPSTTFQFDARRMNQVRVGCPVAGACACDAASFIYSGQRVDPQR